MTTIPPTLDYHFVFEDHVDDTLVSRSHLATNFQAPWNNEPPCDNIFMPWISRANFWDIFHCFSLFRSLVKSFWRSVQNQPINVLMASFFIGCSPFVLTLVILLARPLLPECDYVVLLFSMMSLGQLLDHNIFYVGLFFCCRQAIDDTFVSMAHLSPSLQATWNT